MTRSVNKKIYGSSCVLPFLAIRWERERTVLCLYVSKFFKTEILLLYLRYYFFTLKKCSDWFPLQSYSGNFITSSCVPLCIPLLAYCIPCSLSEIQWMLIYHGESGGAVPFHALGHCGMLWEGLELTRCVRGGDSDIYFKRAFWQELENVVTDREHMAFLTAVIVRTHLILLLQSLLITWLLQYTRSSLSVLCLASVKCLNFLFVRLLVTDPRLQDSQPTIPMFGFNSYGDDRYAVIDYKMSWEKAKKNCRDQYAELASVLDPYTESYLWLEILKHGEPAWIGLNSETVSPSNPYHNHTATPDQHRSAIFLAQRLTESIAVGAVCFRESAAVQTCECVRHQNLAGEPDFLCLSIM